MTVHAMFVAVSLFGQVNSTPPTPSLLLPVESPSAAPLVAGSRPVKMNFDLLDTVRPNDRISIDLFNDLAVEVVLEPAEPDTWVGRVETIPPGRFVMVRHKGVLAAQIAIPGLGVYAIRRQPGATTYALQRFSPLAETGCQLLAAPAAMPRVQSAAVGDCDSGAEVDVLIAYTAMARVAWGGTVAIETEIALAIALTNSAFVTSEIDHQLNLVQTIEVDYDEGTNSLSNHLNFLTFLQGPNDPSGFLDGIPPLRDQVGADLVQLWVEGGAGGCGVTWATTPSNFFTTYSELAYSVVKTHCAVNLMTTPHEFGHNHGCGHEPEWGCVNRPFPGACGHTFDGKTNSWRTIMAVTSGNIRIPQFANPNLFFDGVPTGIPLEEECGISHTYAAVIVANFRCRPDPCPWDLDDSGDVGITDFLDLLAAWGPDPGHPADFDGDGDVGITDFLLLLANWGPCP